MQSRQLMWSDLLTVFSQVRESILIAAGADWEVCRSNLLQWRPRPKALTRSNYGFFLNAAKV